MLYRSGGSCRTHYKGQIRKKLYKFTIENIKDDLKLKIDNNSIDNLFLNNLKEEMFINIKNYELIYNENQIGIFLSAIFDKINNKIYGLCLVKDDFIDFNNEIFINIFDNLQNLIIHQ